MTEETKSLRRKRVKNLLLTGKKYTVRELNEMIPCNNVCETIRQLREEGMNIETEWRKSDKGTRYGVYSYVPPKKVDRIKTREYLNQA